MRRLAPLAGFAAMVLLAGFPGSAASATLPGCTPATNVEAIIDDSASMSSQDPNRFRLALLDSLANLTGNDGLILGGVEFGTRASPLFGPMPIPGVIPALQASFSRVNADGGSTDYEQAFSAAAAHNGGADARIFLTGGEPDYYPASHLSPKLKTYVIGIGSVAANAGGEAVLTRIAAETGGPVPFLIRDASQMQPVAGAISAALNCKSPPLTFTRTFTKRQEEVTYVFTAEGPTADILLSWNSATSRLDPNRFTVTGGGAKKKGKPKVKRVRAMEKGGTTSATVALTGLKKGRKVRFKVKAEQLSIPTIGTTQIIK